MIRRRLAQLREALAQPAVRLVIAGLALELGIRTLVEIVTDLRNEVSTLTEQLAPLRGELLKAATIVEEPHPKDVDPLGRGEQLVEPEPAPAP
jgi:hypothetical protein